MTSTVAAPPAPKFEQTMAGLVALLRSTPGDEPVKNSMLLDWVLPLLEDARDEVHSLVSEVTDQLDAVVDGMDDANDDSAANEAAARQVVVALVGFASLVLQRANWMGKDMNLLPTCPPDLVGEFTKVKMLVQTWGGLGDEDGDDAQPAGAQP